jgi:thioredoxin reductase (NADPH)
MASDAILTDMIVIGAGPVGLFTVFEAGLLNMKCHVIDNLDRPGGQCTQLYPEKPIYDIPSRPKVTGQELSDLLVEQASPFSPAYHFKEQASILERSGNNWRVSTNMGTILEAPVVAIAGGAGSFVAKRPPIPGIEDYEEKSVHYAVRRMEDFRDKNVVIAGGGDSALDWVLSLEPIAKRVILVHRRDEFRAAPDSVDKMRALAAAGKMDLFTSAKVTALEGSGGALSQLVVSAKDGTVNAVPCNHFLPFFGLKIDLGPIAEWGINLDHNHIQVDPFTYATNVPGIYAVGDICVYPGKIKLILSGFHETAVMVHAAFKYARPNEKIAGGYTTTNSELQRRLGVAE